MGRHDLLEHDPKRLLLEKIRICEGCIGEQEAWADPKRVEGIISDAEDKIAKQRQRIDEARQAHQEAPKRLNALNKQLTKLQRQYIELDNAKKIERLLKLQQEINAIQQDIE